jgi:hypothetical protein
MIQLDATHMKFIQRPLSQHVSCIIMPIVMRTMQRTTAYDVQHLYCWLWSDRAGPPVVCAVRKLLSMLAIPVLHIVCGSSLQCSPDDGHIDARNMLR